MNLALPALSITFFTGVPFFMANHAREKRGKNQRGDRPAAPPILTVVPNSALKDDHPSENVSSSIGNPSSWTAEFCFNIANLAREDKNPLPPHTWVLRGHTIAHAQKSKKKHPYAGMPVNEHGETVAAPVTAIRSDWKTELLGAFTSEVEEIKHSDH